MSDQVPIGTQATYILAPRVYVLNRQRLDRGELDTFLRDHNTGWKPDVDSTGAEDTVEVAGRTCYMSFSAPRPGGNKEYIKSIKEMGHGSVLEHAVWTLIFVGVSRTLTHELVRHRAGFAYSQLSQRYVDESVAEYVVPEVIKNDPELYEIWKESIRQSHQAYMTICSKLNEKLRDEAWNNLTEMVMDELQLPVFGDPDPKKMRRLTAAERDQKRAAIKNSWKEKNRFSPTDVQDRAIKTKLRKDARQAARSVLPNATETKIVVTANARAWRHFIEMRGSAFAEPEIRRLTTKVLSVLKQEAPSIFGDYELVQLPDGTFETMTKFKKV